MVKGISRQVILVRSPDPELFDQAIFILKDRAVKEGITEDMLLKQAKAAIGREKRTGPIFSLLFALLGGAIVGCIWAATALL